MALTPKKVYAILKKYTDNSIAGGGAIRGKNCVINSITAITGGHRIEFQWTLDNGTVQTDTMDVMDGVNGTNGRDGTNGTNGTDGVGIASITFKEKDTDGNNVYTITYTDGNSDDITCPIGPQGPAGADGADGVGVPDGGTEGQILRKKSNTDYDTEWVDPSASSQVQSDWSQSDNTKVDYIKNKPTNVSAFNNDAGYITKAVSDLTNYYLKSETYTQAEVNTLIGNISTITFELVNTLPTTDIKTNAIYLVPKSVGSSVSNIKDEYICLDPSVPTWEKIGDTAIDVSGKADKVSGATSGNLAGLDANGNLTDSTIVASKVIQKVTTATGLLKDDGTVDTSIYLTASDISGKQDTITISGKKVLV